VQVRHVQRPPYGAARCLATTPRPALVPYWPGDSCSPRPLGAIPAGRDAKNAQRGRLGSVAALTEALPRSPFGEEGEHRWEAAHLDSLRSTSRRQAGGRGGAVQHDCRARRSSDEGMCSAAGGRHGPAACRRALRKRVGWSCERQGHAAVHGCDRDACSRADSTAAH
jgi:hypothetical protein